MSDERSQRFRARELEAFGEAVRRHFLNHPSTWTVEKVTERRWRVVDRDNAERGWGGSKTRRAALEDLNSGRHERDWDENTNWYLGGRVDPRWRQLAEDEQKVVHTVLAELAPVEWKDRSGALYRVEQTTAGPFKVHSFDVDGFDVWGYSVAGEYCAERDSATSELSPYVADVAVPPHGEASDGCTTLGRLDAGNRGV